VSCSSGTRNGISSSDTGEVGEVKVWNAVSGEELLTLKGHSRYVNSVAYSADGRRLATLSHDNTVIVWNAESGDEILNLKVLYGANGRIVFSPDGKRLASSARLTNVAGPFAQGAVKVWDAQTGEELLTLKGHSSWVTSVAFSPDNKRLVTASGGPTSLGEVKFWDALTGQELLTLDGTTSRFTNDVAYSPDGRLLAGTGRDGRLKIWNATPLPEKP
jgi:sugar lactone lactonase YvrE